MSHNRFCPRAPHSASVTSPAQRNSLLYVLGTIWTVFASFLLFPSLACALVHTSAHEVHISIPARAKVTNIFVTGLGRVRLTLRRDGPVQRWSASVAGGDGSISTASRSVSTDGSTQEWLFNAVNPRSGKRFFFRAFGQGDNLTLRRAPASVLSGRHCASHGIKADYSAASYQGALGQAVVGGDLSESQIAALPKVKLALVADEAYGKRFGRSLENHIAAMLDQVQIIYQRDLRISLTLLSVTRESRLTANLTAATSSPLLDGFGVLVGIGRYGEADVYHLLTARDLDDNIIGLANLPAACSSQRADRIGLSQFVSDTLDFMTVGHEIGHNLGASHDTTTTPSTLMYPSLPVSTVGFSPFSQREINQYISTDFVWACLNRSAPLRDQAVLSAKTSQTGDVIVAVGLPSRGRNCSVLVEASSNRNFSKDSTVNKRFDVRRATALRWVTRLGNTGTRSKAYLRATVQCGADQFVSSRIAVDTRSTKSTAAAVSTSTWIKRLVSGL